MRKKMDGEIIDKCADCHFYSFATDNCKKEKRIVEFPYKGIPTFCELEDAEVQRSDSK